MRISEKAITNLTRERLFKDGHAPSDILAINAKDRDNIIAILRDSRIITLAYIKHAHVVVNITNMKERGII